MFGTTYHTNGLNLLTGTRYRDMLSSAWPTEIPGSFVTLTLILPAVFILFKKGIAENFVMPSLRGAGGQKGVLRVIQVVEMLLPLLAIAMIFVVKTGYDADVAVIPKRLWGGETPLSAAIEPGFIIFVILSALMLFTVIYSHVKDSPDTMNQLKNTRVLVLTAIFIALTVTGSLISIPIPGVRDLFITFEFVFMSAIAFMFGPVIAFFAGMIVDLLSYMINSGGYAFDLRFTITAGIAGVLYAIFLYKRNPDGKFFAVNVLLSKLSVNFIVNIVLTQIWLYGYYGDASKVFTLARIVKNIVLLPVETVIMFFVLKAVYKAAANLSFIKRREAKKIADTNV
ncbi:hypothetical protein FACS1894105_11320 [Clostridia bacterium]|nr:hypothetical protein FACS1894105_11320 [Clostridia bacterium]